MCSAYSFYVFCLFMFMCVSYYFACVLDYCLRFLDSDLDSGSGGGESGDLISARYNFGLS